MYLHLLEENQLQLSTGFFHLSLYHGHIHNTNCFQSYYDDAVEAAIRQLYYHDSLSSAEEKGNRVPEKGRRQPTVRSTAALLQPTPASSSQSQRAVDERLRQGLVELDHPDLLRPGASVHVPECIIATKGQCNEHVHTTSINFKNKYLHD